MSDKSRIILDHALRNGNKITKRDAVALIGNTYYCNGAKHVGDILSRLVKSGRLKRLKRGEFEISFGEKNRNRQIQSEKQIQIF